MESGTAKKKCRLVTWSVSRHVPPLAQGCAAHESGAGAGAAASQRAPAQPASHSHWNPPPCAQHGD